MGLIRNRKDNILAHIPAGNYPVGLLSKLVNLKSLRSLGENSLKEKIQISRTPEITLCLVADIRGFTNLMEDNPIERVAQFLTSFFDRAGTYINGKDGQINKLLGDGFLSYFDHNKLIECLDTAFEILNYFGNLKENYYFPRPKPFGLSISITSGKSFIGTIGSALYMDYTILGRHVNRAFRLVKLSKWGQIWITDELRDQLSDTFLYIPLPEVDIKGMDSVKPIWVFRKKTGIEIASKFESTCSECHLCDRHDICNIIFEKGLNRSNLAIDCDHCGKLKPELRCNHFPICHINWRRGERENELGLDKFRLGRECCEVCQFFSTCIYAFSQAKYFLNHHASNSGRICCSYCTKVNTEINCKNA